MTYYRPGPARTGPSTDPVHIERRELRAQDRQWWSGCAHDARPIDTSAGPACPRCGALAEPDDPAELARELVAALDAAGLLEPEPVNLSGQLAELVDPPRCTACHLPLDSAHIDQGD